MNAQHCLTLAAAFIAVIAACATLIKSANDKAESLADRLIETASKHRDNKEDGNIDRCTRLQKELELFKDRFHKAQLVQGFLFFTIFIFIISLAIFIGLGLNIIYYNISEEAMIAKAGNLLVGIGVGIGVGTLFMLVAICFQLWEVRASSKTLAIETSDCFAEPCPDSPTMSPLLSPDGVASPTKMTVSIG